MSLKVCGNTAMQKLGLVKGTLKKTRSCCSSGENKELKLGCGLGKLHCLRFILKKSY